MNNDAKNHQGNLWDITSIVIDDDVDVLDTFCDYLKTKGVKILGKGQNGKAAVDLYESLRPEFVFIDLMMPKYDGIYALENIRKLDPTSKVVIIAAYLGDEAEQKLAPLKPTGVFIKPLQTEKFERMLAQNIA